MRNYGKFYWADNALHPLTHWDRLMHICVVNQTIIGWNNGLSPGRCQAIIWTNARILLTTTVGTKFSIILIEILMLSFKKMHVKMSGKCQPFCFGLNVLKVLVPYVGMAPKLGHHCACRCPSTWQCQAISSYSAHYLILPYLTCFIPCVTRYQCSVPYLQTWWHFEMTDKISRIPAKQEVQALTHWGQVMHKCQ